MVVLQLGPYPPPHGGVQTNLVAIRDHLRRRDISAPVINLTRHRQPDTDDVYYPRTSLEVVKLLLTIPADIVHLHIGGRLTGRLLALTLLCSQLPGRRVVLTFHSGGYPTSEGQDARPWSFRGFVFRRLDAVIAVNAEIAALFAGLGVPRDRIRIICPYVPVSLPQDVDLPATVRRFRELHSPLLTTVGLLEPEYDLPLQIRSLAAIRRKFPQAGLLIIGAGSLETKLRQLIASEPDADHVLLWGDMPHELTMRTLSASDLFLRTTLYDGDSVSVREALQLGVPVIATDNQMRPDGVHLIPRSDPVALCNTIETVLGRAVLSERLVTRVEGAATSTQSLDEVLELYSILIGEPLGLRQPSVPTSSV